ncbi:TetR family transcriptional regulator [Sorangium sp. So ce363]|uniref:TetR family transcriptional regulator n=1 Tax=Sorangium sp. So ce363 TaxID=3133304 RepID=UPI003F5E5D5D
MEVNVSDELGLRDRKKAATRRAIAEVALRLFAERGFDAVTVADVAVEANVSTKTVFNYFPTKEDLVLGDGEGLDADLLREIETRAPGESVLDAVRKHTLATASRMRAVPAERRQAFRTIIGSAPSVQARWRDGLRRHEEKLAALLAVETGAARDDATPFVVAGVLGLLGRLAFYDVIGWPDGKRRSAAKTDEAIHDAFDRIAEGLRDYGARPRKR